jgi:dTDP-4-amino-4,6-dideoxygalactose transaminase
MLAMAEAVGGRAAGRQYALMPSFTFAATAQAAMWVGLTPLFCDVDPHTWLACPNSENALLERYGNDIALIVPYATFGNNLDLCHYEKIARERRVPVVVDAAASLGSVGADGLGFGCGSSFSIVFSMHATKTFATSEGGVIYSADKDRLNRLKAMANFGFSAPRTATMLGLNGKLSEVSALIALERLRSFDAIVEHRVNLARAYRDALEPVFGFQLTRGRRLAYQFMPALLPEKTANRRKDIIAELEEIGIGVASYFSPHLAEQSFFQNNCVADDLPHTTAISRRILSLPMADMMTLGEVYTVVESLMRAVGHD